MIISFRYSFPIFLFVSLIVFLSDYALSNRDISELVELRPGSDAELAELEERIERIRELGDGQIVVRLAPREYVLQDSLRLLHSNISLIGQPGSKLSLAAGVGAPVVAVGSQKSYVEEADVIEDILIFGIEIDGNRDEQDSEVMASMPWIRANGIDIRGVRNAVIDQVVSNRNRSGGLVVSWKSSNIHVADSRFEENFFDGLAYYDASGVVTHGCVASRNDYAGVSLDNDFLKSSFSECVIEGNGAVGVFARNSREISFSRCLILDSADWGVFLAHDDEMLGTHDVTLVSSRVIGNRGGLYMASVDDEQSSGTRIVNTVFEDNHRDGRRDVHSAGSRVWTDLDVVAR